MSCVKVSFLPRPHTIEFKYVGGLIFDINYVVHVAFSQFTGIGWCNSKEQLHRENGPAGIWDSGGQYWWLNDIEYSEEDFNNEIRRRNELRKRKNLTETI